MTRKTWNSTQLRLVQFRKSHYQSLVVLSPKLRWHLCIHAINIAHLLGKESHWLEDNHPRSRIQKHTDVSLQVLLARTFLVQLIYAGLTTLVVHLEKRSQTLTPCVRTCVAHWFHGRTKPQNPTEVAFWSMSLSPRGSIATAADHSETHGHYCACSNASEINGTRLRGAGFTSSTVDYSVDALRCTLESMACSMQKNI